jgi:molecular chaperone DnaK
MGASNEAGQPSMSSPGKLVGIDLGTTFSAIATLDERGQAVTVPNIEGEMLTPSAVFVENGSAVVGQAARDVALEQPDRVAQVIKRSMGHAKYAHPVAGREFRPETLAAIILRKLVQDAERRIGRITKAVITVPAYFDDTRRKATQDAGRIAGLDVIDILDEPTAAALAYSFQAMLHPTALDPAQPLPIKEETVLVYDLGGGTFDVTLVRLARHRFESLAIEGDVRLGGKDWDDRLVEHVAQQFVAKHGSDPRSDPVSLAGLTAAAERAKRTLSKLQQTSITCSHAGQVLTVPLTRAEFEKLTSDLLMRTRLTTQQVLRQAKRDWPQVDRLLLVGGSTHMPATGRMLQEISGKVPDSSLAVSDAAGAGKRRGGRPAGRCRRDQRQCPQPGHRGPAGRRPPQRHPDSQEHTVADVGDAHLPHADRKPAARPRQGAAGRSAASRRLHQHRRMLDRGSAAQLAQGVAHPGALRRGGQRPRRSDRA